MTTFDWREIDNRLSDADARRECVVCGGENVDYADARYGLVEVDAAGMVRVDDPDLPAMTALIVCVARVCNTCGFVHLHALRPLRR
jgi:hypothetical protein